MIVGCTGCGKAIRRRVSEVRETVFHSRDCYQTYMDNALRRLNQYELLYGPLPSDTQDPS